MSTVTVGIRDFRAHFDEYIQQAKEGNVVVITRYGKPAWRILPNQANLEERMEALQQAGLIEWSGEELRDIEPVAVNRSNKLISDLIVGMRE